MPRLPRKYSETGVYHIMIRGNAKQDIFIDDQDKRKFIKTILQKRKEKRFFLYAYCIMKNHAHLVVKELNESISNTMKRVIISYASYFNIKYRKVGHVFQDRFKSQVIEDDSYLLSAIRYVHNNPEKAKIALREDYPWSSYHEYINFSVKPVEILDILKMFAIDLKKSVDFFKDFNSQVEKREFIDVEPEKEIHKDNVDYIIDQFLRVNHMKKADLNNKSYQKQRNEIILELIKKSNLSQRAIAEATGVNRETIRKLSKEPSPWHYINKKDKVLSYEYI